MAAPLKTMLDRFSWWSSADDRAFERKLGVPVVTGRRGGLNAVHSELLMWMYIRGFLVIGAYWNICFAGLEKGAWDADHEFKENAVRIVENIVWAYERTRGPGQQDGAAYAHENCHSPPHGLLLSWNPHETRFYR